MTPKQIVALIGNIANRPDLRAIQERQVAEINALVEGYRKAALDVIELCEHCADFRNGVTDNGVDEGSVMAWSIIDKIKEFVANENSCDEMSASDVAKLFNEVYAEEKYEKIPETKEEIEAWERSQENSNDIYKVNARIKNLAREAVKANLTAQGDMVINSFTHVLKAFYDFAETVQDKETRTKLIALTRLQEGAPALLLTALGVGVKAPK